MKRKETLTGICFVLPGLIGFIIFILIPVIMSLGISFTEWNFLKGWDSIKFTGLRNYLKLFKDDWFVVSLRNNILFTAVTVPCLLILGLVMADLINRHTYGGSAIRVMIFIPYIASVVAVCTVWQVMLQPSYGPINEFLRTIGIENPPKWLVDEHWALIAIMLINIWSQVNDQTYGIPGEMKYNLVLINKDMLDAAGLDVPSLDWTWDDYREYAEKLTSGSGADTKYGSYFHSWGSCNLWGISSGKGGSTIFNDDKTLTFDNPNLAKFLQLRYDMENVDHSSTPLADVKALNMNYRDQFFNGNIAMLPMGTAMLSDIGNEKYAHDFVTTFARQPLWDKDGEHYNEAGGNIFSIAKTSEHPKEAYDFLRFWTTEGVDIKGMFISNEKGAVKSDSVKQIIAGFEDKLDTDTLTKIMDDPDWVDSYGTYIPDYQSEIDSILTEETDKYLLGSQSLDDTIKNLMDRGNEVIEENK